MDSICGVYGGSPKGLMWSSFRRTKWSHLTDFSQHAHVSCCESLGCLILLVIIPGPGLHVFLWVPCGKVGSRIGQPSREWHHCSHAFQQEVTSPCHMLCPNRCTSSNHNRDHDCTCSMPSTLVVHWIACFFCFGRGACCMDSAESDLLNQIRLSCYTVTRCAYLEGLEVRWISGPASGPPLFRRSLRPLAACAQLQHLSLQGNPAAACGHVVRSFFPSLAPWRFARNGWVEVGKSG